MNVTTASTVGAYLRDLPPDRRVAMARLCSMIRRSARGVRESMRYGLAFYELDGPLFALESGRRHMSLYVAEQDVVTRHKDTLEGVNAARSYIKFSDLNRLPLDVVEKIVRESVAARRTRVTQGTVPTQGDLLKLWDIKEEDAAPPPPTVRLPSTKAAAAAAASTMTDAITTISNTVRDAMIATIDMTMGMVAGDEPRPGADRPAARKADARPTKAGAKAVPVAKAGTRVAPAAKTAKAPAKKVARKTPAAPAKAAAKKPAAKTARR